MDEVKDDASALEALASALHPEQAGGPLRARVLASAGAEGRYGRFADRLARLFDLSLDATRTLLAEVEAGVGFQPTPWPGLEMRVVAVGPAFPAAQAAVSRLAPGAAFPRHGHADEEVTLVLEGGLVDDDGVEVWRGEELYERSGTEHAPVALPRGTCIAATIAYGGIVLGGKPAGR
jgi:anti-sigma factor ChrR (cupin superfamily)